MALERALAIRALLVRAAAQGDTSSRTLSEASEKNSELTNVVEEMITEDWLPTATTEQANAIVAFILMLVGAMTRDTVTNFPKVLEPKSQCRCFVDQLALAVCGYVQASEGQRGGVARHTQI